MSQRQVPTIARGTGSRAADRVVPALVRWVARGAMHRDEATSLSRHTGGRC
jgi:hypothetical protein